MRALIVALAVASSACAGSRQDDTGEAAQPLLSNPGPHESWITHPAVLDEDHYGTSNCGPHVAADDRVFGFGGSTGCALQYQHDDSGCFERATGHDGWIRQHAHRVHCEQVAPCGGGPGDFYVVRLCRDPGVGAPGSWPSQASPCGATGRFGCAPCFSEGSRLLVCH